MFSRWKARRNWRPIRFFCAGAWTGCLLLAMAARADTWFLATNIWSFEFPHGLANYETLSTPAIAPDGTIYAGAFDGKLYALTSEGKQRWYFQAGREIKSSPAVGDDGTIYFGCRDHCLYAVTPGGKLKWKFAAGAWVDSSPAIAADGTVYFGSWDQNFYAVNPDGSLKWKFFVGGIVDSSPAIATNGAIYFGSHNRKFYALDPGGAQRWVFSTGAEISSSPAIGEDGDVYLSSTDGLLYRLKPDGTEAWHFRIGGGSDSSPVLAENGNIGINAGTNQFIVSPAGTLVKERQMQFWMDQTPIVAHGMICFPTPWAFLVALEPDGSGLWYGKIVENMSSSPVIGSDGRFYFACGRRVKALQAPIPVAPAKSPWPMFRGDARHTGRVRAN